MTGRPAVIVEKQNNGVTPAAAAAGGAAAGGAGTAGVARPSFSNAGAAPMTQARHSLLSA